MSVGLSRLNSVQIEKSVSQEVEDRFFCAASTGSITTVKSMLENREISLHSRINSHGYFSPECRIGDVAVYRLANNLEGLQLLVDEYQFPLPDHFLTRTKTREVAEYLIGKKGYDPYQLQERGQHLAEDGKCRFFSKENIERLKNLELYHRLRPRDYREIGEALNKILGVLVTRVQSGGWIGMAPHITCSTEEEAQKVTEFLSAYDKRHCTFGCQSVHSYDTMTDFILHVTDKLAELEQPSSFKGKGSERWFDLQQETCFPFMT